MASLKRIAIEAGLAEATVSRILRGRDQCTPATRERVLELARKHRYRPNMLVRGMQTGRTQTIGVLLPLAHEFFGLVFHGIHDVLVQADHVPIMLWCHDQLDDGNVPGNGESLELRQIYRLIDRRVDGIILRSVDDAANDTYLHEIADRQLPLVAVDRLLDRYPSDFVGNDDRSLGRLAAEYLLGLGHRRLAFVGGPETVSIFRLRAKGFAELARAGGAACRSLFEPALGEMSTPLRALLTTSDRPTAILAASDNLAVKIYQVAAELGLAIPDDLSVVGCGNLSFDPFMTPPLTSIEQHAIDIGREAATLLLQRLDHDPAAPPEPYHHHLPVDLVPRQSTSRAAGG